MLSDDKYLKKIVDLSFKPVFIIGSHRSGTTLLYEILSQNKSFEYVNAYHVIKYDQILANHIAGIEEKAIKELSEEFIQSGINDRVFDSIKVTPELPEEYGFILKNKGFENFLNESSLDLFREMCRKIHFIHNRQYILLKNPWCFPHFMFIKTAFPDAKFIFIHRNPIHVINSKLKAVRKTLSEWSPYTALVSLRYQSIFKNPLKRAFFSFVYSPYLNRGVIRTTNQAIEATQYYLENISELRESDYFETTYENLCSNPNEEIQSANSSMKCNRF
jgi:hypothetical protein